MSSLTPTATSESVAAEPTAANPAIADPATMETAVAESVRGESTSAADPALEEDEDEIPIPDVSDFITEDDTPVDNLIQEKLQRFLVQCLYSSLKLGIPFLAAADVGLFYGVKEDSLAPDVMLSLGVSVPEDWSEKRKRSYFIWEFGKPPDVVIEIVSNKKGGELDHKLQEYARARVAYYVVFDPLEKLSPQILRVYVLHGGSYQQLPDAWMESIGLGLTVWQGEFETKEYHRWLRWCDGKGNLLLTGDEQVEQERQRAEQAEQQVAQERQQAEQERQRAEQERQRAEQAEQQIAQERQRAEQERQRAERLAELLRSQNIDPDE